MPAKPSIDVVIPVYNAPALTRHCIDSVVACLSDSIRHIYVQDDASDVETRMMLDQLPYEHVYVHHAQKNQGFGASVNEAVSRSDASFALILNSDTMASEAAAVRSDGGRPAASGRYSRRQRLCQGQSGSICARARRLHSHTPPSWPRILDPASRFS